MSIKDLIHGVKSLAYEEDPTPAPAKSATKPATAAPASHPAFNLPPASFSTGAGTAAVPAPIGSPFSVPSTPVLDEEIYKSVLAKTNFNTTPVGKAIIRYYDALEGVIADQNARFKAAINQAQKLDNIAPDQVLATFDQLSAALDSDAAIFQKAADSMEASQITARQQKLQSIADQVTALNQQAAQIGNELAEAQANHTNKVTQYGLAQQRRSQEIAAQKAQVASLLR